MSGEVSNNVSHYSSTSSDVTVSLSARIEEKIQAVINVTADPSVSNNLGSHLAACVLSAPYDSVVFMLIISDVTVLLCGVQLNGFDQSSLEWTSTCHGVLLLFFTLEALARIFGELLLRREKRSHLEILRRGASCRKSDGFESVVSEVSNIAKTDSRFPLSAFLLWDSILVVAAVVGASMWGLKSYATILPSMLRTCRVAKLTNNHARSLFLRPLELLLSTIRDSMHVLCFSFFLLLLNMLFFAVLAMGALQPEIQEQMTQDAIDRFGAQTVENCRYAFSSLIVSSSTLFALSTGDQWHDIALPIIYYRPWAFGLFMLHTVISSGIIIGLVYGVLCETLQHYNRRKSEMDELAQDKARKAVMDELNVVFDDIDADNSGYITWQEFQHNRKNNAEMVHIMEKLDMEDSEILIIWDVMDASRDGRVSKDEFVRFMWKVLFDGGKWSQLKAMHCAAQANFRAEEVSRNIKDLQDELHAHRRMLEKLTSSGTGEFGIRSADNTSLKCSRSGNLTGKGPASKGYDSNLSSSTIFEEEEEESEDDEEASALDLMRGVEAYKVSQYGSAEIVQFWSGGAFVDKDCDREFNMSRPCQRCDFFVSHCWNEPEDWYKFFQRDNRLETYGYTKAVELHNVLMGQKRVRRMRDSSFVAGQKSTLKPLIRAASKNDHRKSRFETTVWVDKCCIPQNDKKVKAVCVKLLEEFMMLSDGFIVILSWQYFTRLWCVYEWACFLRTHNASSVQLGFDAFLRSSADDTLPRYIDSIKNLSVKGSQCYFEDDHEILEAKVFQYYNGDSPEESFAAFERFAKCTAICLMAKQLVLWRARGSTADEDTWLGPFRELAERLEYSKLAKVLRRAEPAKWYAQSNRNQESFDDIAFYWFDNDCVQYLLQERARAVRKAPLRFSDASTFTVMGVNSQVSNRDSRDMDIARISLESTTFAASELDPCDFDGKISVNEGDTCDELSDNDEVQPPPATAQPKNTPTGELPQNYRQVDRPQRRLRISTEVEHCED